MGQRAPRTSRPHAGRPHSEIDGTLGSTVFPTDLGWCAACGSRQAIARLTIGHGTAEDALAGLQLSEDAAPFRAKRVDEWHAELRTRLQRYAQGVRVDFRDFALDLPPLTPFQQAVIAAARRIPHGQTVSYSELAATAGYPRAARAVGSVMARCDIPVLIPCHRVITAGGKVGGYGSRSGVALKQRLLDLEAGR